MDGIQCMGSLGILLGIRVDPKSNRSSLFRCFDSKTNSHKTYTFIDAVWNDVCSRVRVQLQKYVVEKKRRAWNLILLMCVLLFFIILWFITFLHQHRQLYNWNESCAMRIRQTLTKPETICRKMRNCRDPHNPCQRVSQSASHSEVCLIYWLFVFGRFVCGTHI